jgi:xylulose-5-phosphate/fructose-6-phosphate phosphoketolase
MAAVQLLKNEIPGLKMRFVNVVDLMRLEDKQDHPHGLTSDEFDAIFTPDKPVVFAFHGYPSLVHRLTYRRSAPERMHVRGFSERGTTTTPFDMLMLNNLDRYRLVMDVIRRVPSLGTKYAAFNQRMDDERITHRAYTRAHGEDPADVATTEGLPFKSSTMRTDGTGGDNTKA